MKITSADLMSVGKVAFAIGGGAVIACGARELGKIGGTWFNDQYKQWTNKTLTKTPELMGGMAGKRSHSICTKNEYASPSNHDFVVYYLGSASSKENKSDGTSHD